MEQIHRTLGWVAIAAITSVGLWGLAASLMKRVLPRAFRPALWTSILLFVVQITLGVYMFSLGNDPGSKHTFYGFLWLFTAVFVYLFRAELEKNPPLRWGLVLLYMGWLGYRGVQTFGLGLS